MNWIYFLLLLAIVIPALALLGHLYVAYKLAPVRAKQSILAALTGDPDFQKDLVKSLMNNLFSEIREGDVAIIPIDKIIERAKLSFSDWFKTELPKKLSTELPQRVDEYGEVIPPDPMDLMIQNLMPKGLKKYLPLLQYLRK